MAEADAANRTSSSESSGSKDSFPSSAQVVIVGGGVVGCSVLYHLTKMGCKDVILLDKNELTSGATWHAAGLVGQLRPSRNLTRMIQYSVELYQGLEAETGQSTGWSGVGGLRLASSEARMEELRKSATMGLGFGLDIHTLSTKECADLFPIMDPAGVHGGVFLPTDGYADPSMLTQALAKGGRTNGGRIIRNTRVTGFTVSKGRVTEVQTEKGNIACETVVNCTGMWARRVGKMAGANVPVASFEHQYMVTEEIKGVARDLPVTRDPDNFVYYRSEVGGLIMGGFETEPILWKVDDIPWDFVTQLLEPDFDQFEFLFNPALKRTPCLETAGVKQLINGPDAYTPDGNFLLGPSVEIPNFFVATGMNCFGIAGAGGSGRMIAEWVLDGEPSLDIYALDIRRFGSRHNRSSHFVAERSREHYSKHYKISWPHYHNQNERSLRRSPLYHVLEQKRAAFGEKSGWERAQWFAPEGIEPEEVMAWGRPNWHEHVGREVKAIREKVALIDQTSFGKIEVRGPDAFALLQRLATRNIDRPPGSLAYTQMCNGKGGIECDLTISRTGEEEFYLVTGTTFAAHDLSWIVNHIEPGQAVVAYDVTSSRGVLNLCGPRARQVLEKVTREDVSNEGFAFGTGREIYIGSAPALALRVSYHGELGWELHIPVEYTAYVYEKLWEAGEEFGIADAGYRALESCRLEKGYFYWSGDLTTDYTPYDAGLGFNVHLKKKDFIGRSALAKIVKEGPAWRMCFFTLEEEVELYGSEPISREGEVLGIVTSGGFGHTIGKTIAFAYLPPAEAVHSDYVIEAFGREIQVTRHDQCLYDPKRERILS